MIADFVLSYFEKLVYQARTAHCINHKKQTDLLHINHSSPCSLELSFCSIETRAEKWAWSYARTRGERWHLLAGTSRGR